MLLTYSVAEHTGKESSLIKLSVADFESEKYMRAVLFNFLSMISGFEKTSVRCEFLRPLKVLS